MRCGFLPPGDEVDRLAARSFGRSRVVRVGSRCYLPSSPWCIRSGVPREDPGRHPRIRRRRRDEPEFRQDGQSMADQRRALAAVCERCRPARGVPPRRPRRSSARPGLALTYARMRPVHTMTMLFGWASMALDRARPSTSSAKSALGADEQADSPKLELFGSNLAVLADEPGRPGHRRRRLVPRATSTPGREYREYPMVLPWRPVFARDRNRAAWSSTAWWPAAACEGIYISCWFIVSSLLLDRRHGPDGLPDLLRLGRHRGSRR